MKKLYVGFDDIGDAVLLGGVQLDLLLGAIEKFIQEEGEVVIEQRFDNAPPEYKATLSTQVQFDEWKAKFGQERK